MNLSDILASRGLPTLEEYDEIMKNNRFISTGYPQLDTLISEDPLGGIPTGRITEIAGANSTGKSRFMKDICLRDDIRTLYIDTENSLPVSEYEELRLHSDVMSENLLENIYGVLVDVMEAQLYDLIVVDSIAVATTNVEIADDNIVSMSGQLSKARFLSSFLRKLIPYVQTSNTALVFINHLKEKVGVMYKDYYTPGGSAIDFATSLRLFFYAPKSSLKDNVQKVDVKLEKNRFGPKLTRCDIKLNLDV